MKYKIDLIHTLEDFKTIEKTEKDYLAIDTISPADETYGWYIANKDIHISVRDTCTNKVVGTVALVPLNKNQYKKFLKNELVDTELNINNIEKYIPGNEYYLLFSAITIQKEYREEKMILYLLLKGIYEKIKYLQKENITFINMCSEGQTQDGRKFLKSFLNLDIYNYTNEGYYLCNYKKDYLDFQNWLEKLPKYMEKYFFKFDLQQI